MGKTETKSHRRKTHTISKSKSKSTYLTRRNRERAFKEGYSLISRAKIISEKKNKGPVKQVVLLGKLINKHADYLLEQNMSATTNNQKKLIESTRQEYDEGVIRIRDYLTKSMRDLTVAYVMSHGTIDIPAYTKDSDDPYQDIQNLTIYLAKFKETLKEHAPDMIPQYTTMMGNIVTEIMDVINNSLEKIGVGKKVTMNELSKMFEKSTL